MSHTTRQETERKVVRHLVRTMKERGWNASSVNDGEDIVKCRTEKDVMDAVFSVDESWIRFTKTLAGEKVTRVAYIVLGNDGWDCICDHALSNPNVPGDDFEAVMAEIDAYTESLQS